MRARLWALAALLLVAGCGGGDEASPAPREALGAEWPAAIATVCSRLAAETQASVLCPPRGGDGGPLEVINEDLDPEPCGYLINLEAPIDRRDGPGPSHAVIGGRCEPLPVDAPAGRAWPADPPTSL